MNKTERRTERIGTVVMTDTTGKEHRVTCEQVFERWSLNAGNWSDWTPGDRLYFTRTSRVFRQGEGQYFLASSGMPLQAPGGREPFP